MFFKSSLLWHFLLVNNAHFYPSLSLNIRLHQIIIDFQRSETPYAPTLIRDILPMDILPISFGLHLFKCKLVLLKVTQQISVAILGMNYYSELNYLFQRYHSKMNPQDSVEITANENVKLYPFIFPTSHGRF